MDCASCAAKIDTAVRRMSGVEDVSVSVTSGTMTVSHDTTSDLAAIGRQVTGLGYDATQLPSGAAAKPDAVHEHGPGCSHDHHHHDHREHQKPEQAAAPVEGLHGHDHGLPPDRGGAVKKVARRFWRA